MTELAATFAIPCRNAGANLRPLLESLLAQTRQDFALILVDDGSTDGSPDVARVVVGERIEIHRNDPALGLAANFNRCARLARTPFFCLAHQDDVYEPTYLAEMVAALEAAPTAGFAHCRAVAIDAEGRAFDAPAERFKERFWRPSPELSAGDHYRLLFAGNYIVCPSVLFRTEAFVAVGGFRPDLRFATDWELWFRMVHAGRLPLGVHARLLRYRRHVGAATKEAVRDLRRYREELIVLTEAALLGARDGFVAADARPLALRNALLQDAGEDLLARDRPAAARKLAFLREAAPRLFRDPAVVVFRLLCWLGPLGRGLVRLGRALALRFARVP